VPWRHHLHIPSRAGTYPGFSAYRFAENYPLWSPRKPSDGQTVAKIFDLSTDFFPINVVTKELEDRKLIVEELFLVIITIGVFFSCGVRKRDSKHFAANDDT
jgi:hypothetical protein